jgi:hypothetical protein
MNKGEQTWIRIRGAPSDPESFGLATWDGRFWNIPYVNSLGDTIYVQIAEYVVVETLPASTNPEDLYRKPAPDAPNQH